MLYDAVYLASDEKLKTEVGRKALILITDGEDQGSTYNIKTAIEQAQKADAIIYSIYYVDRAFYSRGGLSFGGGGGEGGLRKMSEETGGKVFTVSSKASPERGIRSDSGRAAKSIFDRLLFNKSEERRVVPPH